MGWDPSIHGSAAAPIAKIVPELQHLGATLLTAPSLRGAPPVLGWRESSGRELRLIQADFFDEEFTDGTLLFLETYKFPQPLMFRLAETFVGLEARTVVFSLGANFAGCHPGTAHVQESSVNV